MGSDSDKKEFKYVEFIRNPRNNVSKDKKNKWKWMAFDYFDFIDIKEDLDQLIDCMDYQNEIPCEAHQSIGIFRDGHMSPVKTDFPFLAVLQVTFLKEAHEWKRNIKDGEKKFYENAKNELMEVVDQSSELDKKCQVDYDFGIYNTVNNIDFCILLYTDRLDLAEYIANKIKVLRTNKSTPKYSVYTTVGICSDFSVQQHKKYMDDETVLVARVHLKRNFFDNEIAEQFCRNLENRKKDCVTNTHSLAGKYELSIRVEGQNKILEVLPLIINSKFGKQIEDGQKEFLENQSENAILFLFSNDCVRYINTRIFCNGCVVYNVSKYREGKMDAAKLENWENDQQFEKCMKLKNMLHNLEKSYEYRKSVDFFNFKPIIKEYLEKIKRIIHTCGVLSFNDDTKVNMVMLRKYLFSFLKLMILNDGFLEKGLLAQKDYVVNILTGIKYIEQYTKIITSVNGNSFETPQFGTERDECSIGKLPIAYTEYLSSVFNSYYKSRRKEKREGDDEVKYFPQYFPLVVPYMLDGNSDCMMCTLLSQNMSDDWSAIKDDWEKYIEDEQNKILMFIICQDMKKYKDISSLLVSSFHELGHYCNWITRKERNADLLKIYSREMAGMIVRRWIGFAEIGFRTMMKMEIEADLITILVQAVYEALCDYMGKSMEGYMDYPQSVFNEKFMRIAEQLCSPYLNCFNRDINRETSSDKLYDVINLEYGIICEDDTADLMIIENLQKRADKVLIALKEELNDILEGRNCNNDRLNIVSEDLEITSIRDKLLEVREFVSNSLLVWDILSQYDDIEKMDAALLVGLKNIKEGVDISGFMKNQYQWKKESVQRIMESFRYIKGVLECSHETLILCIKCMENSNLNAVLDSEFTKKLSAIGEEQSISEYLSLKSQFIDRVFEKYFYYVQEEFENVRESTYRYYECYARMHLTRDSGFFSGFKKSLNESMMGVSFQYGILDLLKSCYEESLADISMCANLDLEAHEYLTVVMNYFDQNFEVEAKWKVDRLVIVLSYLWFVRGTEEKEKVNWTVSEFGEKLKKLKVSLDEVTIAKPVSDMLEMIRLKYSLVMDKNLYKVAMIRIKMLSKYFCFLDKNKKRDVSFIHDDLLSKLKNEKKKAIQVQNQEIEFLLKYYYRNRRTYSNE